MKNLRWKTETGTQKWVRHTLTCDEIEEFNERNKRAAELNRICKPITAEVREMIKKVDEISKQRTKLFNDMEQIIREHNEQGKQ